MRAVLGGLCEVSLRPSSSPGPPFIIRRTMCELWDSFIFVLGGFNDSRDEVCLGRIKMTQSPQRIQKGNSLWP
jgi:hypothetical protein